MVEGALHVTPHDPDCDCDFQFLMTFEWAKSLYGFHNEGMPAWCRKRCEGGFARFGDEIKRHQQIKLSQKETGLTMHPHGHQHHLEPRTSLFGRMPKSRRILLIDHFHISILEGKKPECVLGSFEDCFAPSHQLSICPYYQNIIWFLKIIQPQIANSYVHPKHSKPTKSQNPKQDDKVSLQGGTIWSFWCEFLFRDVWMVFVKIEICKWPLDQKWGMNFFFFFICSLSFLSIFVRQDGTMFPLRPVLLTIRVMSFLVKYAYHSCRYQKHLNVNSAMKDCVG